MLRVPGSRPQFTSIVLSCRGALWVNGGEIGLIWRRKLQIETAAAKAMPQHPRNKWQMQPRGNDGHWGRNTDHKPTEGPPEDILGHQKTEVGTETQLEATQRGWKSQPSRHRARNQQKASSKSSSPSTGGGWGWRGGLQSPPRAHRSQQQKTEQDGALPRRYLPDLGLSLHSAM